MQLELLWELQELDLSAAALRKEIEDAPVRSGISEKEEELTRLRDDYTAVEESVKKNHKALRQYEMDEQKIIDDRSELKDKMYGGKVGNVKELEQMQHRMDQLAAEKKKVEDGILELMERVEEEEVQVKVLAEKIKKTEDDLMEMRRKLTAETDRLNGILSEKMAEREKLVDKIDDAYLRKYTVLAEKHNGKALARVENEICGVCRVFISDGQRGKLYNQDVMVYCENCGRLLIRFEDQ
ncbi:MAG: hypothetical protein SVV67_08905 [Bacillota bacterium]|nr:hypothetical protein [Bacillota bacterium]